MDAIRSSIHDLIVKCVIVVIRKWNGMGQAGKLRDVTEQIRCL